MASKSGTDSTTQSMRSSRCGSRQMAQGSCAVRLQQFEQSRTSRSSASSAAARSRAYSGGDLSTGTASRCAVLSPTPGRRAKSSPSRAMGSMTEGSLSAVSLSLDQAGDEVLQAAQRTRLLLRQRLDVGQGGVDRGEDQVLEHRYVGLVHHLGIDLHAQELAAPAGGGGYPSAARLSAHLLFP